MGNGVRGGVEKGEKNEEFGIELAFLLLFIRTTAAISQETFHDQTPIQKVPIGLRDRIGSARTNDDKSNDNFMPRDASLVGHLEDYINVHGQHTLCPLLLANRWELSDTDLAGISQIPVRWQQCFGRDYFFNLGQLDLDVQRARC
ncbi:hypothetical protein M0802_005210 [Mischocyttarus mexicanus]|nr:hypothetical protein M0802_005210 [Mischocyttarus mexicanus]